MSLHTALEALAGLGSTLDDGDIEQFKLDAQSDYALSTIQRIFKPGKFCDILDCISEEDATFGNDVLCVASVFTFPKKLSEDNVLRVQIAEGLARITVSRKSDLETFSPEEFYEKYGEYEDDDESDEPEEEEESTVNTSTTIEKVLPEVTDAAWRVAAIQFVESARKPICGLLARSLEPGSSTLRGRISSFLETPFGVVLLTFALSLIMEFFPFVKGKSEAGRLAKELRIKAMSDAGVLATDIIVKPFQEVLGGLADGNIVVTPSKAVTKKSKSSQSSE